MENRTDMRIAAARSYYARRWGNPVPDMTPKFAEHIIGRWRVDVKRGIVAIPADTKNHTGKHRETPIHEVTIGGLIYNLRPGESFLQSK